MRRQESWVCQNYDYVKEFRDHVAEFLSWACSMRELLGFAIEVQRRLEECSPAPSDEQVSTGSSPGAAGAKLPEAAKSILPVPNAVGQATLRLKYAHTVLYHMSRDVLPEGMREKLDQHLQAAIAKLNRAWDHMEAGQPLNCLEARANIWDAERYCKEVLETLKPAADRLEDQRLALIPQPEPSPLAS